jgi:hypothetical protein
MQTLVEQETQTTSPEADQPAFSKELAELTDKAIRPVPKAPQPPPQRRILPVNLGAPYGWD